MTKNKRILIATPLYPPQVGGPATRTILLERKFPEMGSIISVAKFSSVLRFPKVIRHIFYFFILLVKGIRADTIIAQDPVSTGFPALLASKILRKDFVLIIVGDYAWEQGSQRSGVTDLLDAFSTEYEKYPFLVRTLKRLQFFVASHSDKIIVPSFYLKKIVTNWGINEDKIKVVYNSFDPPKVSIEKEVLRKKLGLSGHILVSAGRLVPWKGFTKLIDSVMPKIVEKFPDAKLFIIGDGPDKNHLETVLKESEMSERVFLMGKKPQVELFEYIKAADAFVLNTSYEGMSHQLLEVMALETPIVTTDITPNLEVIDKDQNGILVPYNGVDEMVSALSHLLGDRVLADKLTLSGKEKIKKFTEEKMLLGLKQELL
jgi:glycosyltransferase involved in cell wall biosynthesis